MSQIVKCDLCGKAYNQSYVNSHKRLSHGIGKASPSPLTDEPQKLATLLKLYEELSESDKKQMRSQLTTRDSKID